MKKSILFLTAFMFLGLSFAKAQLVTMYDVPLKNSTDYGNVMMVFENTDAKIRINALVPNDKRMRIKFSLELNGAPIVLGNQILNVALVGTAYAYKVGNRTHIIRIDEKTKKCLYGFFDEQPDTTKEFSQKAIKEFNQKAQKSF